MRTTLRHAMVLAAIAAVACAVGCDAKCESPLTRSPGPVPVESPRVKNLWRDADVWIGGQPEEGALADLKTRGVRTVIDLRLESQKKDHEEAAAKALGLEYVPVPMASNALTDEQAEKIVEAMRSRRGGVLIHCSAGNRAAGAYGLWLGVGENLPAERAIERARKAGLSNQELMRVLQQRIEDHAKRPLQPTSQP